VVQGTLGELAVGLEPATS